MRVRFFGTTFGLGVLSLAVWLVLAGEPSAALARLQDDATPEAETRPEASPTAERLEVTTLVAWYAPDPSGDFLQLGPLQTNAFLVAGPGDPAAGLTGRADFDSADNDELPRITLGDSVFDAYPIFEDDPDSVFRWLFFNGEDGARPATLVIQVRAVEGPYKDSVGTATFVSRAPEAGGVLIIVLNPAEE